MNPKSFDQIEIKKETVGEKGKLLSENLEIIQTRELSNTAYDSSWVLASNAANELSKANGPKVAVFEVDGFDTHAAQGSTNGAHADCLSDYDKIVKSLKSSMSKEAFDNTLILTLTEFGRTIKQNSSNGTEHGYGSAAVSYTHLTLPTKA